LFFSFSIDFLAALAWLVNRVLAARVFGLNYNILFLSNEGNFILVLEAIL